MLSGNVNTPDPLAIPNRITPGVPDELLNQPMNEYNDLRNVLMFKPHILEAVGRHFTENTGLVSELLYHTKKTNLKVMDKKGNVKGGYDRIAKNIEIIGNHEFAWRIAAPTNWVYRIVEDVPAVSGRVGVGGAEFYMVVNKQLGEQDDVIMLADGNTQVIITAPPQMLVGGNMRIRVRQLVKQGAVNSYIPAYLLERGKEAKCIYNIKPEASEHGSKIRIPFGDWAKNYMTTQRWEWNLTGLAAHTQIDPSAKMQLSYFNGKTNSLEKYWIPVLDYEMMKQSYMMIDNQLFWGKKNIDPVTGQFRKDSKGRTYFSGDGIYHQMNRRLKRQYNRLNSFRIIDDLLRSMNYDSTSTTGKKPVYLAFGGVEFRTQFDRLIRNEFKLSPEVLYFDGSGGYQKESSVSSIHGSVRGIKSNFNYYETPHGCFIVSPCHYFDSRSLPTQYDVNGLPEQSYRAILINITPTIGGQDVMSLVSLAGRQNVIGRVNGMSNPGSGGTLSTTADVEGKHMLNMCGVGVHNPNCIAELRKSRRRF